MSGPLYWPFFDYRNGSRQSFDPLAVSQQLVGCLLCGKKVAMVGVFCPTTDRGRVSVLRLRTHALPTTSEPGLAYGLCRKHARHPDQVEQQVEDKLCAIADKVEVQ